MSGCGQSLVNARVCTVQTERRPLKRDKIRARTLSQLDKRLTVRQKTVRLKGENIEKEGETWCRKE